MATKKWPTVQPATEDQGQAQTITKANIPSYVLKMGGGLGMLAQITRAGVPVAKQQVEATVQGVGQASVRTEKTRDEIAKEQEAYAAEWHGKQKTLLTMLPVAPQDARSHLKPTGRTVSIAKTQEKPSDAPQLQKSSVTIKPVWTPSKVAAAPGAVPTGTVETNPADWRSKLKKTGGAVVSPTHASIAAATSTAEEQAKKDQDDKEAKAKKDAAEAAEKAKKEAEAVKIKAEADAKAKRDAEQKLAQEKAAQDEKKKKEAAEAAEKAKKEAEAAKAKADAEAKRIADAEKAKKEADAKAKKDAEEQAKKDAEEKAKKDAEEKARLEEVAAAEAAAKAAEQAAAAEAAAAVEVAEEEPEENLSPRRKKKKSKSRKHLNSELSETPAVVEEAPVEVVEAPAESPAAEGKRSKKKKKKSKSNTEEPMVAVVAEEAVEEVVEEVAAPAKSRKSKSGDVESVAAITTTESAPSEHKHKKHKKSKRHHQEQEQEQSPQGSQEAEVSVEESIPSPDTTSNAAAPASEVVAEETPAAAEPAHAPEALEVLETHQEHAKIIDAPSTTTASTSTTPATTAPTTTAGKTMTKRVTLSKLAIQHSEVAAPAISPRAGGGVHFAPGTVEPDPSAEKKQPRTLTRRLSTLPGEKVSLDRLIASDPAVVQSEAGVVREERAPAAQVDFRSVLKSKRQSLVIPSAAAIHQMN